MESGRSGGSSLYEWLTVIVITGGSIAVSDVLGLSREYRDLVCYTAIVFSTVTVVLRSAWSRSGFWWTLLLLVVLHVTIFGLAEVYVWQFWKLGIYMVPFGMFEMLL